MSRKLASIQIIKQLESIKGADFIEVATVQGWQVVVKKGDFQKGDKCCFFEIDSQLPEVGWSEFLRGRKFRVKTIKLRKQLSQGLALPLDTVSLPSDTSVGADVTERLGVTKHDPQALKESRANNTKRVIPHKWLLRFSLGRRVHQVLWPKASGSWPEFINKTDETRVQNISHIDKHIGDRELYATEKLDGQSVSIWYNRAAKVGLMSKGLFGVCSRNIWYKSECNSNWWDIAKHYRLNETLKNYCEDTKQSLCIQGEIIGRGIQKDRYSLGEDRELYVFNVYDITNQRYLPLEEKAKVLMDLNLNAVPRLLLPAEQRKDTWGVTEYLENAEGLSVLLSSAKAGTVEREGLVWRDVHDDSFSFKAISNKFLLQSGE